MSDRSRDEGDEVSPPTWVDLALGQGPTKDLLALRERIALDPFAAVEFAETRDLLERFRDLGCVTSSGFEARMAKLGQLAESRGPSSTSRLLPGLPWAAAAALVMFSALAIADPLSLRRGKGTPVRDCAKNESAAVVTQPYAAPAMPSTIANAIDATQRLAPGTPLEDAWTRFAEAPTSEQMAEWVEPTNAISFLRFERELRDTADLRRRALRDEGLSAAICARAERLAAAVASQAEAVDTPVRDLALALRALVGAGSSFDRSAIAVANRLQAGLADTEDGDLAMALCALGETAAVNGSVDGSALQQHGRRLVSSVLVVGEEVWGRRRPRLLLASEPASNIAAAGRFLRIAPAFGVDSTQSRAVRLLLLAHLQERREGKVETPDVPTAMAYGFQDLLDDDALATIERSLRRWRPEALAPDYLSLQMFAATRRPDLLGFARWQLEVRKVAALADPGSLAERAALSRCLSDSLLATAMRQELAGL